MISLLHRFVKNKKKTLQLQMLLQETDEKYSKVLKKNLMRGSVLHKQRKQSRRISKSRKVLELWFRTKTIKGTFVPSISPQVHK